MIKKERNSSIEMLRIIAMLMIVLSHYVSHGGADILSMNNVVNKNILQMCVLGNLGVAVFSMISGYFLSQLDFKPGRVLKIEGNVLFYSVVLYLIYVFFCSGTFEIKTFLYTCFPIITEQYWFATCYVVLILISPLLNTAIKNMPEKMFFKLICAVVIMWSVIPTFLNFYLYSNNLIRLIMYYLIGAYIKRNSEHIKTMKKYIILILVMATAGMFMSTVVLNMLAVRYSVFNIGNYFYSQNSILVVAIAACLLIIFENIKINSCKIINNISACTFGVYLIHDNKFIRDIIWKNICRNAEYANSPYLIFHILACVISVFVLCVLIEYIRSYLFHKAAKMLSLKK